MDVGSYLHTTLNKARDEKLSVTNFKYINDPIQSDPARSIVTLKALLSTKTTNAGAS